MIVSTYTDLLHTGHLATCTGTKGILIRINKFKQTNKKEFRFNFLNYSNNKMIRIVKKATFYRRRASLRIKNENF